MNEKVDIILKDVFSLINNFTEEEPIESPETKLLIRVMNRMMNRLQSLGHDFGYVEVDNVDGYVDVPDGAMDSLIANLALTLYPYFYPNKEVPNILVMLARNGMQTIRILTRKDQEIKYQNTLPVGSGNSELLSERFYSET